MPSKVARNATEEAASHEMSDSEGEGGEEEEEESGVGGADGRVKFPTLVTKSDFEDSEDIAAGKESMCVSD